jgi:hypothetical protein
MPAPASETRAPIALDPGEGEALWFNNDLLIFKATGAQTGGAYLLVEEVARRGKVTPLHTHPPEEETFYVLDGEALMHPRRPATVGHRRMLRLGCARRAARISRHLRDGADAHPHNARQRSDGGLLPRGGPAGR